MARSPTLTDGIVLLDEFRPDDLDAHVSGEDEEHARRLGWYPDHSTRETALTAFERWGRDWAEDGPTRALAARRTDSGELVGGCQLRLREKRIGELSYWTFPQHRGRGFARRAAALLCRYGFENLGIERIEAYVEPDNSNSRRVVEAVGFQGKDSRESANLRSTATVETWCCMGCSRRIFRLAVATLSGDICERWPTTESTRRA